MADVKEKVLGASLMITELAIMLEPTIKRLNTEHPGLNARDQEAVAIMRSLLQGVEDKARDMAKALLIASQKPSQQDIEGPI
jgi:hypothetical protein